MELKFNLENKIDKKELLKSIGFVSESIRNCSIKEDELIIDAEDICDLSSLKAKVQKYIDKFVNTNEEKKLFENIDLNREFFAESINDTIKQFGDGLIGLNGVSLFLFEFFDSLFESIALKYGAIKKIYPVLLPIDAYIKTGYIKNSPQYATFCCSPYEDIEELSCLNDSAKNHQLKDHMKEPNYALSPSACFHTYLDYENHNLDSNTIVTFRQSVFRNEGRFNYSEIGRLRDYHVREIVLIGNQVFVEEKRGQILNDIINILKELNLDSNISIASDPFVMPKIQKFKKIQVSEEIKYEVRLSVNNNQMISVASLNLHGKAFTQPFNIEIDKCDDTVTGCVGFGIERWVLSFLCQYGSNPSNWPLMIKNKYLKGVKNDG